MSGNEVLLVLSVVATGLVAGLFYGWSVSVIPGTRRIGSRDYVGLMQHINREILTPPFLVPFVGVPVLLLVTALLQFRAGDQRRGVLVALSAATYTVGVFGVTAARNVPLNNDLDGFDLDGSDDAGVEERRRTYETPWNRWNTVRTVANVVAFALVAAAAAVGEETD